jgi:hypothetical protein
MYNLTELMFNEDKNFFPFEVSESWLDQKQTVKGDAILAGKKYGIPKIPISEVLMT